MATANSTSAPVPLQLDLSSPKPCPSCGEERIVYREPDGATVLVCVECSAWRPTDEFPGVEAAVRLAMVRRAAR